MKVLFCHDGPINKNKAGVLFSIGFNDSIMDRYSNVFNKITIATRVRKTKESTKTIKKSQILSKKYGVVECPNMSTFKSIFLERFKCKKILRSAILNNDAAIIRLPSFIGNVAIDVCEELKKPYIVELVGCPWDSLRNHSFVGGIIAPLMYFKTKKRVKRSKYVIYVTNSFLQKRYPTNGESISCSDVELPQMSYKKPKNKNIKDHMILGTIGVLDIKYKGQEYVFRAIKELKKHNRNIKYSLVGSGDKQMLQSKALKLGIEDSIEIIGVLSHEEIFKWLESIDIYIQPSTTEGMPRGLIEAMSASKVCCASNVGGMPELLDGKFIFTSKKSKEIYRILNGLTQKEYEEQTVANYNKSREFNKNSLDKKRMSFLRDFKKANKK